MNFETLSHYIFKKKLKNFHVLAFCYFLYSKKIQKTLFMYLHSAFSYTCKIQKTFIVFKNYLLRETFYDSST